MNVLYALYNPESASTRQFIEQLAQNDNKKIWNLCITGFIKEIHRSQVDSPHKEPVMRDRWTPLTKDH